MVRFLLMCRPVGRVPPDTLRRHVVVTFVAIVSVILLSAFIGSTIAWALAQTVFVAMERRRLALVVQPTRDLLTADRANR